MHPSCSAPTCSSSVAPEQPLKVRKGARPVHVIECLRPEILQMLALNVGCEMTALSMDCLQEPLTSKHAAKEVLCTPAAHAPHAASSKGATASERVGPSKELRRAQQTWSKNGSTAGKLQAGACTAPVHFSRARTVSAIV